MQTNYKKLKVWNKALDLVEFVYDLLESFPLEEKYGLVSQMKRAVVSIPSNIAEWAGRNTDTEFKQFLHIAKGSCYELETQILIASRLGYISEDESKQVLSKLEEIMKMLQWLINSK